MAISIKPILCTQCGGTIQIKYPTSIIVCPYCGTNFSVEYNNAPSKSQQFFSEDNPIDVIITRDNSDIVKGFVSCLSGNFATLHPGANNDYDRIKSVLSAYSNIMGALSGLTKETYKVQVELPGDSPIGIGSVQYRAWSYDKVNWNKKIRFDGVNNTEKQKNDASLDYVNGLISILRGCGFEVNEYWSENTSKVIDVPRDLFAPRKQFCKTYTETCRLEGVLSASPSRAGYLGGSLQQTINKISNNDVVDQISEGIINVLQHEATRIIEIAIENPGSISLSIRQDSVLIKDQHFSFHSLGMDNIQDKTILHSLAVVLANRSIGKGPNALADWRVCGINVTPEQVSLGLTYKNKVKKAYKGWLNS